MQPKKIKSNLGRLFQTMALMTDQEIWAAGKEINWTSLEVLTIDSAIRRISTAMTPMEILLREAPDNVKQVLLPLALQTVNTNFDLRMVEQVYDMAEISAEVAAQTLDCQSLKTIMNHSMETRDGERRLKEIVVQQFGMGLNPLENQEAVQQTLEALVHFEWQLTNRMYARPDSAIYRQARLARFKIELVETCLARLGLSQDFSANARTWANYWLDNMEQCEVNTLRVAITNGASSVMLEKIWQRIPAVAQHHKGAILPDTYRQEMENSLYRQRVLLKAWDKLNDLGRKASGAITEGLNTVARQVDKDSETKMGKKPKAFTPEAQTYTQEFCQLAQWCIERFSEFNLVDNELLVDVIVSLKMIPEQEPFEQQLLDILAAKQIKVNSRELTSAFIYNNGKWWMTRLQQAVQQKQKVDGLLGSLATRLKTLGEPLRQKKLDYLAKHWQLVSSVGATKMDHQKFAKQAELTDRETIYLALQIEHYQKLAIDKGITIKVPRL